MLKNLMFIVVSHNKYQKNLLSLRTFISVIINITKLNFSCFAKILSSKGFRPFGSPFFMPKNSLY